MMATTVILGEKAYSTPVAYGHIMWLPEHIRAIKEEMPQIEEGPAAVLCSGECGWRKEKLNGCNPIADEGKDAEHDWEADKRQEGSSEAQQIQGAGQMW
ncbi:hypothetical protein NDU88_003987 [Pleurodeles waltl]|uniref:Uncharacterized protein n=1 Tax=Pleurodeles waltl TaxID=8319 RepID=A0AAV7W659_PLEWA|nr:hypothetical protein NDU88_003987 [Pleurodeles waltl]